MRKIFLSVILLTVFLAVNVVYSDAQSPEQLYQKGLIKEEGEGALQDAISIYNQVADNLKADPSLRAKALLHVGMCYEKLGNQEAVKAYNKLVNNFPTQKNEVTIARERLSKLITAESSKEIVLRQLWTGQGVDDFGSVSADGEYLTFTDWGTGNLMIRNLKTGENKPLTREGSWKSPEQYAEFSLLSPDGKQVVYMWFSARGDTGSYELRLLQTDSQSPTILYTCNKNEYMVPELWLSNNKKIIVQKYYKREKWQISSIDITSKKISLLKERIPAPSGLSNLSLSPDEKQIAFDFQNLSEKDNYDISLMYIDSKNESPLVEHPANDRLVGWLPDRNEVLFSSNRSGTQDLWVVNALNLKSSGMPIRIFANIGEIRPLGFKQDGSLYYGGHSSIVESFILPLDQSTSKISENPRTIFSGQIFDICWLPEGESLIYRQYSQDQKSTLGIYNRKTGVTWTLADNIIVPGSARISPDGKSVLVMGIDKQKSVEKDYAAGIYSIDIKTGNYKGILIFKRDSTMISNLGKEVEWDKDGKCIFYTRNNQIMKHNIETGKEKIIYTYKVLSSFTPTLRRSFDGTHLLFDGVPISNEAGKLKEGEAYLLSIPEDGGEASILCNAMFAGTVNLKKISLSPDGKYIYFSARTPEINSVIYRIPADGGTPEIVWQSKDYNVTGISIHPDGKQIALSTSGYQAAISVIENLGRKVTEVLPRYE
jgi:Tol biopolymer transport system component